MKIFKGAKTALVLLAMFGASSAWAEWTAVAASDDKSETHYFDLATMQKESNYRKVWEIIDRKKKDKDGTQSFRGKVEYDCKEGRYRILSMSAHSESMAKGNVLGLDEEAGIWREIPPGTLASAKMLLACAK